ncbi:MAG: valine--tRNA ligase [Gemmatales bacterium]|nr:valine--tRNA ligase [Gemmatales bacterium]MDW7994944.1 valine--tRNA ligase [Gemmatales bacterium]
MTLELPKQYDPQQAQARWLAWWLERGYYDSDVDSQRTPFTVVIPPPNVTGALHLGHALNNTLQDVLVRWRRMQGYNACWVPGTDHAGIATQAVVEKLILQQEGKTRHDLGREELVRRIWQWKDQYEARILSQLRELGCSCDWRRTRFTLDPVCSRAVRETFFRLFRAGLIYRGYRLVNWDTTLQTAVADDEIFHETVPGYFWTFKYPIVGTNEFIRFATTRPETMLGDTAVAVHPEDPRYRHLLGKKAWIPLVNREIPIIADAELVDPTLGTGAVKVTPAHDFRDYECGLRHGLPMINILRPDGTINENGGRYVGLDRYEARQRIIEDMRQLGLFESVEERQIELAHSDRSKTPIEPYLSEQWFIRMASLAERAIEAVESGQIRFFPERYARTYLDWLREKRDWCISRQLWWGHRIPIWYSEADEELLRRTLGQRPDVVYRRDESHSRWLICSLNDLPELTDPNSPLQAQQDPDVLDTWFSSALWPHEVFGWPDDTPDLRYYYPTSVLVTSRDIITLWVARMVMMGLYNTGQIPFHHVYVHPKILDGFGETMSKSKGNGVDPLDIIALYGTDALRFGLCQLATETQDVRMPVANVCPHCQALVPQKQEHLYMRTRKVTCPQCKKPFRPGGPWPTEDPELPTARQASERFEIGRNFANKLWNAARFVLLHLDGYTPADLVFETLPIEDRWMLSRLSRVTEQVTRNLESYQLADVARGLYDFTWSEFCDWYVEMSKTRLRESASRPLAQRMLVGVLDAIIRLLHPVMPFVTESLWQALNQCAYLRGLPQPRPATETIMLAPWPDFPSSWQDPQVERLITQMQELVRAIRNLRSNFQVPEKAEVEVTVRAEPGLAEQFQQLRPFITQLARVQAFHCGPEKTRPPQAAASVHADFEVYLHLQGLIDIAAETKRLQKQRLEKERQLQNVRAKLANDQFISKAPAEVVQQQRQLEADLLEQLRILEENLQQLQEA